MLAVYDHSTPSYHDTFFDFKDASISSPIVSTSAATTRSYCANYDSSRESCGYSSTPR